MSTSSPSVPPPLAVLVSLLSDCRLLWALGGYRLFQHRASIGSCTSDHRAMGWPNMRSWSCFSDQHNPKTTRMPCMGQSPGTRHALIRHERHDVLARHLAGRARTGLAPWPTLARMRSEPHVVAPDTNLNARPHCYEDTLLDMCLRHMSIWLWTVDV